MALCCHHFVLKRTAIAFQRQASAGSQKEVEGPPPLQAMQESPSRCTRLLWRGPAQGSVPSSISWGACAAVAAASVPFSSWKVVCPSEPAVHQNSFSLERVLSVYDSQADSCVVGLSAMNWMAGLLVCSTRRPLLALCWTWSLIGMPCPSTELASCAAQEQNDCLTARAGTTGSILQACLHVCQAACLDGLTCLPHGRSAPAGWPRQGF